MRLGALTQRGITPALGRETVESPHTGAELRLHERPGYHGVPKDGALTVVRRLKQGMGRFPAHVHLDFAERFVVTKGVAVAKFDGDELRLSNDPKRSTLYVPPGVPHVNPYNDETDVLEFRQSFMPPTEAAYSYVATLAEVLADGRDDNGELPWSLILAIGKKTGDRTYLTPASKRARRADALSFKLQRRILLPAGDVVAGRRKYKVHLDGG